jgi:CheY-like chemotaxis protein
MEFASGGNAALEILSKARFDVVVTEMRMPGMDGASLD